MVKVNLSALVDLLYMVALMVVTLVLEPTDLNNSTRVLFKVTGRLVDLLADFKSSFEDITIRLLHSSD